MKATYSLIVVVLMAASLLLLKVEAFKCFGVEHTSPSVCSGKGSCIFDNFCICDEGSLGSNCELVDCGWEEGAMGAPRPAVSAKVSHDHRVVVSVSMTKKHDVKHRIGFQESLQCLSTDSKITPNGDWVLVEDDSCHAKYQLNRTIPEHLKDPEVQKHLGQSDIIEAVSPIFASYLDFSDGDCQMTTFRTEWTLRILLQGSSAATVQGTQQSVGTLKKEGVKVMADGRLEILASLKLTTEGNISNLSFLSSSVANLGMLVRSFAALNERCGSAGLPNCNYSILLQSSTAQQDYTGVYKFSGDFVKNGSTSRVELAFNLNYASATPSNTF